MKRGQWLALAGGIALGAIGTGMLVRSLLPARMPVEPLVIRRQEPWDGKKFPDIDVTFLRCGSVNVPAFLAVRGTFSLASRLLAHSAVLIRHPRGTFLYDTGLCADISLFLMDQSLFFRKTLGAYDLEMPIGTHLQQLQIKPSELDFAIVSHLHWDHVSGVPDLPGVPLRIARTELESVEEEGGLDHRQRLVRRLLGDNPQELFELTGPPYAGFAASYDLFDDGSIVLVPLPGHTQGQVGMFIHRNNGADLFLIADAAWIAENFLNPAPLHSFYWSRVSHDTEQARQTLVDLHHFARRHPQIPMIAMHDARTQEAFMRTEQSRMVQARQR